MTYRLSPILAIASICAQKAVQRVVLSPGSRVAPLTLAFARHPAIQTYTISDERSAGFIAMGIAQQSNEAVAVACTSGTAALNYGPAIAEAFYQQVPLIVFTADRPPEWVDQQDGQTIRQSRLHQNHVKASYDLPVDYSHSDAIWHIERIISEAINTAQTFPKGPVHINTPFREPFYPVKEEILQFPKAKVIEEIQPVQQLPADTWQKLLTSWNHSEKVLIVGGQDRKDGRLAILKDLQVPVVSDVISNLHIVAGSIKHQDGFLAALSEKQKQALQPDLLITFGKSVISKNLKIYLRENPATKHWHIQTSGSVADVYQSLTTIIRTNPINFFQELSQKAAAKATDYQTYWQQLDVQVQQLHRDYFTKASEMNLVKQLLENLPEQAQLHLSNSMPVRYANLINLYHKPSIEVWGNRGTSGIDGSSSTAVGHALTNPNLHILLTGDLSFLYDRNAFWHNYPLQNLRIIVINNQGGVIFRMIDGPRRQEELEEYFVTQQAIGAANVAQDFAFDYQASKNKADMSEALTWLMEPSNTCKLLEVHTDSNKGQADYLRYKAALKNCLKAD